MLGENKVVASLPVFNLRRARRFYEEKLGLRLIREDSKGAMLQSGEGTFLYLYKRLPIRGEATAAAFFVDDIAEVVKVLRSKKVKLQEREIPSMGIKTVAGIATQGKCKSAWFRDEDSNLVAIFQKDSPEP